MQALRESNEHVAYCEGGALLVLLYCSCFDRLHNLALRRFRSDDAVRSKMYTSILVYTYFLDEKPDLPRRMVADVESAEESAVMRAFDTLKSWQGRGDGWAFRDWIGVDRDLIQSLFRVLRRHTAASIATRFLSDPYAFSIGWPDLVWVNDDAFGLVEVKTTDRLHWSQIVTFADLCQAAEVPVEVYQIAWSRPG